MGIVSIKNKNKKKETRRRDSGTLHWVSIDNGNAKVQKLTIYIFIYTHQSRVPRASPKNSNYFDRWYTVFSQAPPLRLGAGCV